MLQPMGFVKDSDPTPIAMSQTAERVARKIYSGGYVMAVEHFFLLCLDNRNRVKSFAHISTGGITSTVVDVRVLFKHAVDNMATAIILVHNHPSGKLKASKQDIDITEKIKQAGKLLDIRLLDHLILTEQTYFSFADNGLM